VASDIILPAWHPAHGVNPAIPFPFTPERVYLPQESYWDMRRKRWVEIEGDNHWLEQRLIYYQVANPRPRLGMGPAEFEYVRVLLDPCVTKEEFVSAVHEANPWIAKEGKGSLIAEVDPFIGLPSYALADKMQSRFDDTLRVGGAKLVSTTVLDAITEVLEGPRGVEALERALDANPGGTLERLLDRQYGTSIKRVAIKTDNGYPGGVEPAPAVLVEMQSRLLDAVLRPPIVFIEEAPLKEIAVDPEEA